MSIRYKPAVYVLGGGTKKDNFMVEILTGDSVS